jgi:hypothetical protein
LHYVAFAGDFQDDTLSNCAYCHHYREGCHLPILAEDQGKEESDEPEEDADELLLGALALLLAWLVVIRLLGYILCEVEHV